MLLSFGFFSWYRRFPRFTALGRGDGPERAAQVGRSMGGRAGIWYGVPLFGRDGANGAPIALRFCQDFFAASDLTVDP